MKFKRGRQVVKLWGSQIMRVPSLGYCVGDPPKCANPDWCICRALRRPFLE